MKLCGLYSGLCLIGVFLSESPLYAATVSSEEIAALEQQAQKKQQEHKKLQAQASQLNFDLNKLNEKMIAAAKKLQQEETATTRTEEELKSLEEKLKVSEEKFNAEYKNLAEVLAALQNLALHPTQSMMVMPLTPVEVVRSAVLMRTSVPYLNENAEKIKQDLEKLTKQKLDVENKLKKLDTQKASLQKQQENLKKMTAEKTALRQKLEGESKKSKEEALRLAAQATDLKELLEKAEKEQELRRRKKEEQQRAAREREEARHRLEEEQKQRMAERQEQQAIQNAQDDADDMVSLKASSVQEKKLDFAGAKGKLIQPASGSVITYYGEELSKGVNSKGLVIKTRAGAQVVAPYDGTVIFSGPFKGYGNLIIMEHGQGYVSLVAGMNAVETDTGQMVLAGEPVGVMPDTATAKLYIEIRKDQHPVNPAPWFGVFN